MDQAIRNQLQRATQDARQLLEAEFVEQLEGTYDILPDGTIHDKPGAHLDDRQSLTRRKLVDAIQHRIAGGKTSAEAVDDYTREAAFTFLNRFVALKMLEARGLIQQCVSNGEQSSGFKEFTGLAPGLAELPDKGYRLYLECLFDELSIEVKILFDRQDVASLLWPRRQALDGLLATLNQTDLDTVWDQDETIGWVYQYFNSTEERKKMREESAAPRNSHELAVRNQFFTPRYVVEFLTDNTLGRIWYEMRRDNTKLAEQCQYLVRRPTEIFLGDPQEAAKQLGIDFDPDALPETVQAAYRGDFAAAISDDIGSNRWWIALAIPPCQFEKITGEPLGQLHDYLHLDRVWDALDTKPDDPILKDAAQILVALSQYVLTSSGGPYAVEPTSQLWNALQRAVESEGADALSQEELLKQPVFIPFRPKKDPRDLEILDPACGSGHFLLYCFDLLLTIYEEAWHDEESPESEITGKTIREDYPTVEALREAVPGLILRHNLHGIEIDPRCAQIAAFALWMQAQRAYSAFGAARNERPPIRKTNIVIAEPMPGEPELLKEFTATLNPPLLGKLVGAAFEKMKLAGEAGSLLKIEEEIRDSITEARKQWGKSPEHIQMNLFGSQPARQEKLDFSGITDDEFWHQAEDRIYEALHRYVARMRNGHTFNRRLFAEDTERGFAFIDLCRKRYDVVLMNPPFGEPSSDTKQTLRVAYHRQPEDLYCWFVERATQIAAGGFVGVISSDSFLRYTDYATYREYLADESRLGMLFDLGWEVLDEAYVSVAIYVLHGSSVPSTLFSDVTESTEVGQCILSVITNLLGAIASRQAFCHKLSTFSSLDSSPFCFWLDNAFFKWARTAPKIKDYLQDHGIGAGPHNIFFRLYWEVPAQDIGNSQRWPGLLNGGIFAPYYRDDYLCIDWRSDGEMIKAHLDHVYPYLKGNIGIKIQREHVYYKPGITYGKRTDRFNAQLLRDGMIPSFNGIGMYPQNRDDTMWLVSYLNSRFVAYFLNLTCGLHKNSVYIDRVPLPSFDGDTKELLSEAARELYELTALSNMGEEISHVFVAPLLACYRHPSLHEAFAMWRIEDRARETRAWELQSLIEKTINSAVPVSPEVLCEIAKDQGPDIGAFTGHIVEDDWHIPSRIKVKARPLFNRDDGQDSTDLFRLAVSQQVSTLAAKRVLDEHNYVYDEDFRWAVGSLISWCVGCGFERWKWQVALHTDIAGLVRDSLSEPIGPQLVLYMDESTVAKTVREGIAGIMVDDPGHSKDIGTMSRAVIEKIWGGDANDVWREAAAILNPSHTAELDLRGWLRKGFFDEHLKRYSKSRRKAPIYWQLATPSGSYSVWLYYHRFTKDTFYKVLNDYVRPKLEHEQRKFDRLRAEVGPEPTRSQLGEIDQQETFVAELKVFAEEIGRIAPLWNPDLNDGVIINFAPLWRLVPQHKAWQKECKACWDKLLAGNYDWAHLAMHLWPERVVPKCRTDASLAIAHGLEEVFWKQDEKGKRVAKDAPDEGWESAINKLVAERTSPAVKAALESLRSAPTPSNGKRTRKTGKRRTKTR